MDKTFGDGSVSKEMLEFKILDKQTEQEEFASQFNNRVAQLLQGAKNDMSVNETPNFENASPELMSMLPKQLKEE
jgi:hypothetical protein